MDDNVLGINIEHLSPSQSQAHGRASVAQPHLAPAYMRISPLVKSVLCQFRAEVTVSSLLP